jgi:hypothetical protein
MNADKITRATRRYMPRKPLDYVLYAVFALAILKLVDLYTDINEHEDNWAEFKEQHNCELKKTTAGNVQLAWQCDDGRTYYRWRQAQK